MKKNNELKIDCNNNIISFYKQGWNSIAQVDYSEENFELIKNNKWSIKGDYIFSNSLKKYLHRIIMERKIGIDGLTNLTKNGFVVDHINNDEPFNCCSDNLHIIHGNLNKAKGLTVDKDIEKIRINVAIGLYCLDNNCYQITIGFNKPTIFINEKENFYITGAYLDFDNFNKCYNAIQIIITWANNKGKLNFYNLQASKIILEKQLSIQLTEEEKNNGATFITRNNQTFMRINNNPQNGPIMIIHKLSKKQ